VTGAMTAGAELREVRGWVEAPVATLKTGNGLRDKDLLKAMEAEAHPAIRFDLAGLSVQSESADSAQVSLSGSFTIHGVKREVAVPANLYFQPDGIRVKSDFPMNVKDYGVTKLSKMLGTFKMNENIMVHIDLVFVPGEAPTGAAPAATPPAAD
jgi:polyisoprenoid-binding protein YceI